MTQTVTIAEYTDKCREADFLRYENSVLNREMNEIRSTNQAKIREELISIRNHAYNLFKRIEKLLEDKYDPDQQ